MKEKKYNLHTRHHIPKDYECCWNCRHMQWMVALGQGARCSNKKNEYRVFREEQEKPMKLPVIPGVAEKCELFEGKREVVQPGRMRALGA